MNRRISQGQAMRSILGRSRVIHLEGFWGTDGTPSSGSFAIVGLRSSSQCAMPPSRNAALNPAATNERAAFWLTSCPCTQ